MKRFHSLLVFILLYGILSAQEGYKISKPELSLSNNILTIRYDIAGCGSNEYVNIRLIVLTSKGDSIKPVYVSGDVGKSIKCGFGKSITWNLEKEKITMSDEISVIIRGEKNITVPIISEGPKKFTRGNIILSSLLVPGLGQSKASGKKCFLVFGGLAYGSLGASVYFATKSGKYNEDYHSAAGQERDVAYDNWEDSYNKSRYFAIGAAGLWITNIIWSAVIPINYDAVKKMNISFSSPKMNEFYLTAKWNF